MILVDETRLGELPRLMDRVHDRWLDIGSMLFSPDTGRWSIRFGETREDLSGSLMEVSCVTDCEVRDRARIDVYSINVVKVSLRKQRVAVLCDPGVRIRLTVGPEFQIRVTCAAA